MCTGAVLCGGGLRRRDTDGGGAVGARSGAQPLLRQTCRKRSNCGAPLSLRVAECGEITEACCVVPVDNLCVMMMMRR